jgi:hydrogenase maturation protein HypF
MNLSGWVNNTADGVLVEVEGARNRLEEFLVRIPLQKPAISAIHSLQHTILDPIGYDGFEIVESEGSRGDVTVVVLPDIATCPDCLRDVFDPADRRYLYPFTNCTNCGPRFSIIEALPYDRPNTTMKGFEMCPDCRAEYEDPANRRFHAQPNACPVCGPRLEWWDGGGRTLAEGHDALLAAADAIRRGDIVALKGLGGFQLLADARNEGAVKRLRERKHREEKPFALMTPTVEFARAHCTLTDVEAHLLRSPEAPIVLLMRGGSCPVTAAVAPGNPYLGVMAPYTPLHHLLMSELGFPVVATSGNLAEEPICIDEREALQRLGSIADAFLVHNRPIARHADDSVVRVVAGRVLVLRRARGYAPLPVALPPDRTGGEEVPMLALGGHLKNTVAIAKGGQIFVSQHIGDMSSTAAFDTLKKTVADFRRLYRFEPGQIVCDMHPDYVTTRHAPRLAGRAEKPSGPGPRDAAEGNPPVVKVQHHFAHVMACMTENELRGPALGVSWDGTGYGPDATVWGGEFLRVAGGDFERVAHIRRFPLPGGETAVKEPRRSAVGLLYQLFGVDALTWERLAPVRAFTDSELELIADMLRRRVNSPITSSAGRLFDAVASLIGLRHETRYEGQAAMELEFATHGVSTAHNYPIDVLRPQGEPAVIDWRALIHGIMEDVQTGVASGLISAKFHNTLAESIVAVARIVGEKRVVLTGGCFQNKYLTEKTIARLETEGYKPYWHQRIPPNDGGIALGQLAAAAAANQKNWR